MKKKSFIAKSLYVIPLLFVMLMSNCDVEIIPPPHNPPIIEPPVYDSTKYTQELKGKVILENQTEHSNALVYLDSLNRGAGTDSSGNYSLQFSQEDSIYDGTFKLYFFVNEFEMDSAQYVLVGGKVKLDSLDVDSVGNLPTKELEQLLLIEGWTDKKEYRAGDLIAFTGRFTNMTNRMIHIFIYSCWQPFGFVGLYNDNYHSYNLSPCDPVLADCDIYLQPNDYYEGQVVYIIPDGYYCDNPIPLPEDKFIVVADLFIEGRRINYFTNPLDNFVGEEWWKHHRGTTPMLDWYPNKYKYPIITIIE